MKWGWPIRERVCLGRMLNLWLHLRRWFKGAVPDARTVEDLSAALINYTVLGVERELYRLWSQKPAEGLWARWRQVMGPVKRKLHRGHRHCWWFYAFGGRGGGFTVRESIGMRGTSWKRPEQQAAHRGDLPYKGCLCSIPSPSYCPKSGIIVAGRSWDSWCVNWPPGVQGRDQC